MRRETKITPGSNMMWESSRMMLPEHVEAWLQWRKTQHKKNKPELDEQQLEEIEWQLVKAYQKRLAVTLSFFKEGEVKMLRGMIVHIDPDRHCIKMDVDGDMVWLHGDDVLAVSS